MCGLHALSMEPPERLLPAQIGRYQVVRLLGQGAMGRVLLAHDPVLERAVAVKLLRDDLGIPPEQRASLLERMRQEARASARVSHPNIVALHDMGEDLSAGLFLVFEYVEGPTLKDRLVRGPLGSETAARLARELGSALTTAHGAGVLHRDIKPENVIFAKTGGKIADFGIARLPDSTLTRDGGLLGTPAYSAPEAITLGQFSPLTDQFSLAATLYEALSGRRAFPGDDAVAVATRISTEEPPRIAEVCGLDPHVDTVFARALSKNPRSRFATCEEFGQALAEAIERAPRTAMETLPDQRRLQQQLEAAVPPRPIRAAVLGALVGAALVLGGVMLFEILRKPTASDPDTIVSVGDPPPAVGEQLQPVPTARPKRVSAVPSGKQRADAGVDESGRSDAERATARDAGAVPPGELPEQP